MIAICVDPFGTQLFGTVEDLRRIQTGILGLVDSATASVSYEATSTSPGSTALSPALSIRLTSGPTLVSLDGTDVVVQGSGDSLARFASWFEFPELAEPGDHSHFEPMPGDPFHSPDSVPLVITVSGIGV